ncbi:MAG: hypothetical protein AB1705_25665 [Verrucomicrobiota bacterium]
MAKHCVLLGALACSALLFTGCGDSKPAATPTPPPSPAPAQPVALSTEDAPPPPSIPGSGSVTAAPAIDAPGTAAADENPVVAVLGTEAQAYFQDEEGRVTVKSNLDLVQRAVQVYVDLAKTKHDDSPDWPPMTDLNLLVKYRILRSLPEAPPGQKFVLDPKTRKVSLAGK